MTNTEAPTIGPHNTKTPPSAGFFIATRKVTVMTVSTAASTTQAFPNGVTTVFPINYRFFTKTDLKVLWLKPDGTVHLLVLDSEYTVQGAGNEDGGSITTVGTPLNGGTLTIARIMTATQLTSFRNQGEFFAEIHEDAFDKLVMLVQQAIDNQGRGLTVPVSDPVGLDLEMPGAAVRATKMLGFDSAGSPVQSTMTMQQIEQQPALAQAAASDAAASAGQAAGSASAAGAFAVAAAASANLAQKWAENPEDAPVTPGLFSAHHWANKAAASLSGLNSRVTTLEGQATTLASVQAATGTAINFNSIPAWVNRIVVNIDSVSTSGTSPVQIQLGTAASFEVTGYNGGVDSVAAGASSPTAFTTGLALERAAAASAASVRYGTATFTRVSGNTWIGCSSTFMSNPATCTSNCSKVLTSALTRLRITTVNGTDAFDSGQFSILMD